MNQLYVVGIGPGEYSNMTLEAEGILRQSEVIVGYTVYVDLIKKHFPDKEYIVTGMRQEEERCRTALEAACHGKKVSVVCSGDAGVYGMAGLLMELGADFPTVEVRVAAGITAALSGAAVLGAPLGHDFAVVSLSDLMTPWEAIEKRLAAAAGADFCICLYNPSSKKRMDYLKKACSILLQHQLPGTVCGIVQNIGREGQNCRILPLSELSKVQVDMFTTVFIGNSQTKVIRGQMVTPRGYSLQK
ncbi:precorrin-3B C(17)-methyltransferase [bacterium 1xD8-6]|nr:precorrin-3B C(17)-methyltransferase [bacterium D16-36]RKI72047.1 precorrin-3B C(17)-methyltransferase [bacterium 1xD8-6]